MTQPGYTNYDALKTLHQARIEAARASAVASGLSGRRRRMRHQAPLRSLRSGSPRVARGHNPETLFFA